MKERRDFRDLIERIRERNEIVEVVLEELALDRSHKALCPFHSEKTPSFHVNPAGQYFKCFGCGASGDVFRFVELRRGVSFMEALRLLAARGGVAMEGANPDDLFRIQESRRGEEVLAAAADYYHSRLTDEARSYLHRRGLNGETISRFKIGYADGGLLEYLTGEGGFPIEACLRAGVVRKTNGGRAGDYFYKRIIFPDFYRGRVVHLSGRSFGDAEPRYLHLPGEIRFFFNQGAFQSPRVILAEGVLDCLPAVQAGFDCAALYGTARFRESHLPLLERAAIVYLCLDPDPAGRRAAARIAGLVGERARIVELPEGVDLGDYLNGNSPGDFQKLLDFAPGLVAHELRQIPAGSPKIELPRLLNPVLRRLALLDPPQAEAYLNHEIKNRFELKREDIDAYRAAVKRLRADLEKEGDREAEADFLWEDFEPFNPAQDYRKGKAYFCVYLQKRDSEGAIVRAPYVVTSAREMFPLAGAELDRRSLRLFREGQVPSDMNRWSTSRETENSVHAFLQDRARVDPVSVFAAVRGLFSTYLDYPEPLYHDFLSLWCVGTYFFMLFESYPYVFLSGTKRTGKTRTIEIAAPICFNSVMSASMTGAAMFRSTEADRCAIFHDEAAQYSQKRKADFSERLEIFNSGYKRSGSVRRCVGDDNIPADFSTYSPKLLASIEGLEQTSADRAVALHLLRARGELPKFSHRRLEKTFQTLRDSLYILALQYHAEVAAIYSGLEMVKGLKDREDELWSPIFALAEFFDGRRLAKDPAIGEADLLTSKMIRLAYNCRDRKLEDEMENNPEQRILAAVVDFMAEREPVRDRDGDPTEYYDSETVLAYIKGRDTLDWVTKHFLGKVLSRLQIVRDMKTDRLYLRVNSEYRLDRSSKQVLCYRLPRERVSDVAQRYALTGVVDF